MDRGARHCATGRAAIGRGTVDRKKGDVNATPFVGANDMGHTGALLRLLLEH